MGLDGRSLCTDPADDEEVGDLSEGSDYRR